MRRAFEFIGYFLIEPMVWALVGAFVFTSFLCGLIATDQRDRDAMERRCYDAGGFWHHNQRLCTKPGSVIDVEGSR